MWRGILPPAASFARISRTTKPFPEFTFYFRHDDHGLWRVHAYQYAPNRSTFIVECTDETWRRAGMDGADEVVATLKEQHVRVLFFTEDGTYIEERRPQELDHAFGRLRTPRLGPDGDLYVTTSNTPASVGPGAGSDQIVRVHPTP